MENLSLGQLFQHGQATITELEETSLASADAAYQEKVSQGLRCLSRAQALVDQLSIFSSNEILEDINTHDLRFLLIPAYLGELTLKQNDTAKRGAILDAAKDHYLMFLHLCQEHQLVQAEDLEHMKRYTEAKTGPPPAQQRHEKIAQFKREKAMREKLKGLRAMLDTIDENNDARDETEREWVMALVELTIMTSLQQLHGIEQEAVMVKEMEAMANDRRRMPTSESSAADAVDRRIPPTWGHDKPLMTKEGKPLQPFVITNKRQQLKDQVFRPGWSLPTMSIDEYLQREEERGNIIRGGGESSEEKKEIDDNDTEALDAETMKQRAWDEYTEANPRGAGNTMNRG